jgi:transcription elongation factor GreA
MENHRFKEYMVKHLVQMEESRLDFLDMYFPAFDRYHQRKQMEGQLDLYISKLEKLIVSLDSCGSYSLQFVCIGSTITIQYVDTEERETFTICLPEEADPDQGCISFISPLGGQLLMAPLMQTVAVQTPEGQRLVRIESITMDITLK